MFNHRYIAGQSVAPAAVFCEESQEGQDGVYLRDMKLEPQGESQKEVEL